MRDFEVDSTESVWYRKRANTSPLSFILKLTPQSQYGIDLPQDIGYDTEF